MRYEIQTLFANGEWQNPDGETYATLYDAATEFIALVDNCEYSVRVGYMEDFNAADWRVRECEYEEC